MALPVMKVTHRPPSAVHKMRSVVLVPPGATKPTDHDEIGEFDIVDEPTRVLFHNVRDILYHQGVLDMQALTIAMDDEVFLISFDVDQPEVTVYHESTGGFDVAEVNLAPFPGYATNKTFTVASDTPEVATVAVSGTVVTITGVDAGEAEVTVTHTNGDLVLTQTIAVTVLAGEKPVPTP